MFSVISLLDSWLKRVGEPIEYKVSSLGPVCHCAGTIDEEKHWFASERITLGTLYYTSHVEWAMNHRLICSSSVKGLETFQCVSFTHRLTSGKALPIILQRARQLCRDWYLFSSALVISNEYYSLYSFILPVVGRFVSNSDGWIGWENVNMFDLVWLLCWSGPALSAMCSCLLVNEMSKHLLTHTKLEYIKAMIVKT